MTLYFITGNRGKFDEVKEVISSVQQIDLDLPEIQELDARKVIEAKLHEARKLHAGEFICEDTSISLDCLNGFPGPLIKWLIAAIGINGIHALVEKFSNPGATAITVIGYSHGTSIEFFEGATRGIIVAPRGTGFGWDPIFQPAGSDKTFGEMELSEKNKTSMRHKALLGLKHRLNL